MKLHLIVTSTGIFLLCFLVFGVRGLDASVCSVLTYLAGVRVGKKEQAVADYIDGIKVKTKAWYAKTLA